MAIAVDACLVPFAECPLSPRGANNYPTPSGFLKQPGALTDQKSKLTAPLPQLPEIDV
jgi:hypothetical protein